ncbi:MAG: Zn-ribbon domain-containing OB-fold protein, partial [Acidimicrobiales bacterium]
RCSVCDGEELDWAPASGRARLVSWAVVPSREAGDLDHSAGSPIPPAVPAIVELDEGPWWWSRVVGADPGSLVESLRLRVVFQAAEGGEAVPVFAVADEGGQR